MSDRLMVTIVTRVWRHFSCGTGRTMTMKALNVAEKNDAARSIAQHLSSGTSRRREGLSKFNKIYEFNWTLNGRSCNMLMTSVSGHLLTYEFPSAFRKWTSCSPVQLFDCPLVKQCPADYLPIKRTLEREAQGCQWLIIWTDCDREGENIGGEVVDVCRAVNPALTILRARFSEITSGSVRAAISNLQQLDMRACAAVDVRQQLDLRIGAAFTRFQTLRLRRVFPASLADQLISYGSCQFPTLGFVVERFKAIEDFIPEPFWRLKAVHVLEAGDRVEFSWARNRLFDQLACQVLFDKCGEDMRATVTVVHSKPKSKWRPLPLDTVELEKLASRKLRINAKSAMKLAEKLYTQGFISYPRTETNSFPKDMDLRALVERQTGDARWGEFASRVLQQGVNPRQGSKSDKAHPPIHPIKCASVGSMGGGGGDEARLYELIVRHFLACVSADARGHETQAVINVAGEEFNTSGLAITERNYLDVYPYDKWSEKQLPVYRVGDTFAVQVSMCDGETSPPSLLTEADLITLMDKHGIGTDATHAEHIETIKTRQYVGLQDNKFVPGRLGLGLVEGYDNMGFRMSKPHLRAQLEADLKRVCDGVRNAEDVLREQIQKYRAVFERAIQQAACLDTALTQYIGETPSPSAVQHANVEQQHQQMHAVCDCPCCHMPIIIKTLRDRDRPYLSCSGYPACRLCVWLPDTVQSVQVSQDQARCAHCAGQPRLLCFTFSSAIYCQYFRRTHTACVGGCDQNFLQIVGLKSLAEAAAEASAARNNTASAAVGGGGDSVVSAVSRDRTQHQPSVSRDSSQRPTPVSRDPVQHQPPMSRDSSQRPTPVSRDHTQHQPPMSRDSNQRPPLVACDMNQMSRDVDGGAANDIVCTCGIVARQLTVRKDGPNKGRLFYRCGGENNCSFFMWADDNSATSTASVETSSAPTTCNCGLAVRRCTVQKAGVNQGRQFDACGSTDRQQQCRFFQWCDESQQQQQQQSQQQQSQQQQHTGWSSQDSWGAAGGRGRGHGGRGGRRAAPRAGRGSGGTRKCGLCHQPGHNRKNCPSAVM